MGTTCRFCLLSFDSFSLTPGSFLIHKHSLKWPSNAGHRLFEFPKAPDTQYMNLRAPLNIVSLNINFVSKVLSKLIWPTGLLTGQTSCSPLPVAWVRIPFSAGSDLDIPALILQPLIFYWKDYMLTIHWLKKKKSELVNTWEVQHVLWNLTAYCLGKWDYLVKWPVSLKDTLMIRVGTLRDYILPCLHCK